MSKDRGWDPAGPCSGIQKDTPNKVYPDAQTLQDQQIIYFCTRLWDGVGTRLKNDVTKYEKATIATDGTQLLDNYMTPGAILLHEMTHQIFSAGMFLFSYTSNRILVLITVYRSGWTTSWSWVFLRERGTRAE